MSLDLFQDEIRERMAGATPMPTADVGVWDGFARGSALLTLQGLAKTASAIDILGAVGPVAEDAFTGGTEAQDRYFREHDEVWGGLVDKFTPKPNEVGVAAHVVGGLVSTLGQVMVSPALAVGSAQVSTAEELVRKNVPAGTANLVGATQALGLGVGLYVPILGQTLAQRVLVGGAGFNLAQGAVTRGVSEALLAGTPGEGEFKAFDPTSMTLDVLLGAAFGGLVHLSPAQRAQGAAAWERLSRWGENLSQTEIDALVVLRQSEHLGAQSMPGRPVDPVDIENHGQALRQAIEQLGRDQPVNITDLPAAKFEPDAARLAEAGENLKVLESAAEEVRVMEGLPKPPEVSLEPAGARVLSVEEWKARLPEGDRELLESVPKLGEVYAKAVEVDAKFSETLRGIAAETGAQVVHAPIKGVARAVEKVKVDYAGDATKLKDLVRGTLLARTPEQAMEVVDRVLKSGKVVGEPRNNLDVKKPHTADGYRDAKVNLEMDGHVVEIQVNVPEMAATKERLHPLYEEIAKIERKAKAEGRDRTAAEVARSDELLAQMRDGYVEAWERARAAKALADTSLPLRTSESNGNLRGGVESQARTAPLEETETGTPSTSKNLVPAGRDLIESTGRILLQTDPNAPAALLGGGAESPPPRGAIRPGKTAGAAGRDPVIVAAERFATEQPDLPIRVGTDESGGPIVKTAKEYLAEIKLRAKEAAEDAKLFDLAATCLYGGGR